MKKFLQDIFTLRTVWIDQGGGKWKVKKRMHPFMRGILILICAVVGVGVYAFSGNLNSATNAEAVTAHEPTIVKAELPKPEMPKSEPVQEEVIFIPLAAPEKTEIVLPSPRKAKTDKIMITEKSRHDNDRYRIFVSKSNYTLSLFKGNKIVKEYPVAIGKNPGDKQRKGDHRTPVGDFKIVSIENASKWKHDFGDGKGKIAGAYGPWFLRLDAKGWKGIGIHGTHDPDSRGTNATEGCIRLSNEDIDELKQYAYKDMPVTISEN